LLEVADQRGDRLVDVLRQRFVSQHVAVRIPVARRSNVDQFDESHATFNQSARRQTLPAEAGLLIGLQTVTVERVLRFICEIKGIRHRHLHPERRFKGLQASGQLRVTGPLGEMLLIHLPQCRQFQLLDGR
jgi:hypothetical protein